MPYVQYAGQMSRMRKTIQPPLWCCAVCTIDSKVAGVQCIVDVFTSTGARTRRGLRGGTVSA